MPISLRAAALRAALERALDEPVHLLVLDGRLRFHTAAPDPHDRSTWQAVMPALSSADRWGSCDTTDVPEIWAEIHEG
ncbi:hypothetical protein G3M58_36675 [Streptomyces sp. SID7499]|uniref:Uncharacterized protein n=1 Tax=Streptomyces sp. SID7499 TaxID=2706086 RepID=A0A6G3X2G3_9ACTN|nr:hypothetical protein [Streptomyces sp. SID7499]